MLSAHLACANLPLDGVSLSTWEDLGGLSPPGLTDSIAERDD